MPRILEDHERLDARLVLAITKADKTKLDGIAERAGLAPARIAREALLAGLPLVAARRRGTRYTRKPKAARATA